MLLSKYMCALHTNSVFTCTSNGVNNCSSKRLFKDSGGLISEEKRNIKNETTKCNKPVSFVSFPREKDIRGIQEFIKMSHSL